MNETPRAVFIALLDELRDAVFGKPTLDVVPHRRAIEAWGRAWLDRYDEAEGVL